MLEERANFGVAMMARALGVSRSGFYRWLNARPDGADPWAGLKEAMLGIWRASKGRFGFRKVHSRLAADFPEFAGTTRYRVRKYMRELGIRGRCPNASRTTTVPDEGAPARPDLVRRDFESPVPTYKLVGDSFRRNQNVTTFYFVWHPLSIQSRINESNCIWLHDNTCFDVFCR